MARRFTIDQICEMLSDGISASELFVLRKALLEKAGQNEPAPPVREPEIPKPTKAELRAAEAEERERQEAYLEEEEELRAIAEAEAIEAERAVAAAEAREAEEAAATVAAAETEVEPEETDDGSAEAARAADVNESDSDSEVEPGFDAPMREALLRRVWEHEVATLARKCCLEYPPLTGPAGREPTRFDRARWKLTDARYWIGESIVAFREWICVRKWPFREWICVRK